MATHVPISKRLVLINSASSILARLINVGVLVWLHQYLIRHIGREDYALYTVIMAIVMLIPILTRVFTGGLSRYVVEAYAKGDWQRVSEIATSMFWPLLVAGIVIAIVGVFAAWRIDALIKVPLPLISDARWMTAVMLLFIAFHVATAPWCVGLEVRQKFVLINMIQVGQEVLRLTLLCVLFFGVSSRVLWVVIATAIAAAANLLVTMILSLRYVPSLRIRKGCFSWARARELTTFGSWNFVASIADLIRRSADPYILNRMATSLDVTCFGLGSAVMTQVQSFALVAGAPLLPALTAMHAHGDRERLRNAYVRGGRYALWAVMAVAAPLIVFRRETIDLYVGSQYRAAATVMALLLLSFPIGYGNTMLGRIAHATAQVGPLARWMLIMQLSNLALTLYLVGALNMGAIGSATATIAVAAIFQPLILWPMGRRMVGASPKTWWLETVMPGLTPALIGCIIWSFIRVGVKPHTWLELGSSVTLGMLVYLAVLYFWCLKPYDRMLLVAAVQRFRVRRNRSTATT